MTNENDKTMDTQRRLKIILNKINQYSDENLQYNFGGQDTTKTTGYSIFTKDRSNPINFYHYYFGEDIFERYNRLTEDDVRILQNKRELLDNSTDQDLYRNRKKIMVPIAASCHYNNSQNSQ